MHVTRAMLWVITSEKLFSEWPEVFQSFYNLAFIFLCIEPAEIIRSDLITSTGLRLVFNVGSSSPRTIQIQRVEEIEVSTYYTYIRYNVCVL